jgi:hypothetical protein
MKWLERLFSNVPLGEVEPVEPQEVHHTSDAHLDSYSSTWKAVASWAETELIKARESNDSAKRDIVATSLLRGRIATLKELLVLPYPKERKRRTIEEDY